MLKAGDWYEATAQLMGNQIASVLFLFPGSQDFIGLHRSGMAEPPDGSIFAEFREDRWSFRLIGPEGWSPIDRFASQLLALTFAAVTALATNSEDAAEGDLALPGRVRGRYKAWRFRADPSKGQMIMGVPRFDLYGEEDCTLTAMAPPWSDYEGLRRRAEHVQSVGEPFQDRGARIPIFVITGSRAGVQAITERLRASEPRGITFGEMEGVLAVLAGGLKDTYVLMQADEERESIRGWWYQAKANGGAHAIVLADADPDRDAEDWNPPMVAGVFEFGKQQESGTNAD